MGKYRQIFLRNTNNLSPVGVLSVSTLVTLVVSIICPIWCVVADNDEHGHGGANGQETSPVTQLPASPELNTENSTPPDPSSNESTVAAPPEQQTPCIPVIIWPTGIFDVSQQKVIIEWDGDGYQELGKVQAISENSCNAGSFPVGNLCGEILEIEGKRFDLSTVTEQISAPSTTITKTETKSNCGDAVAVWEVWNDLQREEMALPAELHGISIDDPMVGFNWLDRKLGTEATWTIFSPEHFGLSFRRVGEVSRMMDSSAYFPLVYCSSAKAPHFSVPVSGIISRMIMEMKLGEYKNLPKKEDDYGWFVPNHFRNVVGDRVYSFLLNTAFHSPRLTSGVGAVARQFLRLLLDELPQALQDTVKMELGRVYCASSLGEKPYGENKLLQEILAADTSTWVESYGYYTSFFARRVVRNTISPPTLPEEEINERLLVVREMHHQVALAIEEAGEVPPRCVVGEVEIYSHSPAEQEETPPETTSLPKVPPDDTNPEN